MLAGNTATRNTARAIEIGRRWRRSTRRARPPAISITPVTATMASRPGIQVGMLCTNGRAFTKWPTPAARKTPTITRRAAVCRRVDGSGGAIGSASVGHRGGRDALPVVDEEVLHDVADALVVGALGQVDRDH